MMTREEVEATLKQARKFGGYGLEPFFESLLAHDQAQLAMIEQQAKEIDALRERIDRQATTITEYQAENTALREALRIYKEASYQSHSGHWDMTGQHGAGCIECIRARGLREQAEQILAQYALKEVTT